MQPPIIEEPVRGVIGDLTGFRLPGLDAMRRATVLEPGFAEGWRGLAFALYHYITAGYTVPVDHWHMGIHLSGVLLLVGWNR